jgi:hypothetical protein
MHYEDRRGGQYVAASKFAAALELETIMDACGAQNHASVRCGFCGKPFPFVAGRLQRWRAPNGAFYCTEFCADDAEEAAFQNRGRSKGTSGGAGRADQLKA